MIAFAVSSVSFYGMFAWLPELLIQSAGLTPLHAGALLSLYGLVGIPFGLVLPSIAVRMQNVGLLILAGVAVMLVGNAGLLFAPATATWLWVVLAGCGNILFPVCLVLINLRTRSPEASAALSGFVQSVGYTIAALGPFAIALLRDLSGGWAAPLVFLSVVGATAIWSALVLNRPRFVEDELG
jgi:CP family cyanate transporter-like MFS transporter